MKRKAKAVGRVGLVLALAMIAVVGVGMVGASSGAVTVSVTTEAPVCQIGVYQGSYVSDGTGGSSASIGFGTLTGGQTVTPGGTDSPLLTVYNDSTKVVTALGTVGVTTGVTISGTDWTGTGWPVGSVSDTTAQLTAWDSGASNGYLSAFSMPSPEGTASGLLLDMGPGGYGTLAFGLTVPSSGTSGAASQTVTVASTC